MFIGGEDGKYATVRSDGGEAILEIGRYEGAIPHIGEANFISQGRKSFPDAEAAQKFLIERAGIAFLLDIIGSRAYPARV